MLPHSGLSSKKVADIIDIPIKILLVDDKQENLFSLEQFLADDDYNAQFIKCTSGNQALSAALKEDLALILLDVQMPGMDGYEVARFLKENKKTRSIPIIFVTALDHEINYILEGYKKGAVDYLFKPLNPSITKAKVKAFIQAYLQQKELEQKNQMLQNLVMLINNSIDLMCILDAKTLVVNHVNPSWATSLGLKTEDILDHPIDLLPFQENSFQVLHHSFKNVVVFENYIIGNDGKKKWFSWSFVKDQNSWFGNGKDITKNKLIGQQLEVANEELEKKVAERTEDLLSVNNQLKGEIRKRAEIEEELKRNNQRLARANEELDSFVYAASHDLKAPISNIEVLINILRKKLDHKVTQEEKQLLEMVDDSVAKFNSILKDLSTVIAIDKELEEEYQEIQLPSVLEDVMADIHDLAETSKAEIRSDLQVSSILFTRKNIRSIFYNLISNAIKYRSPDRTPVVEVSSREEAEFIILTFKDNGLGLKESQKEKMFGMFKRFHKNVDGAGIGLFLLKKIIENSGGRIELESEEGKGSTFTVYLKNVKCSDHH